MSIPLNWNLRLLVGAGIIRSHRFVDRRWWLASLCIDLLRLVGRFLDWLK